jgi:hypothetical protein
VLNRVNGTPYPRYHFSSASHDIRAIFGQVALLAFIGPKR